MTCKQRLLMLGWALWLGVQPCTASAAEITVIRHRPAESANDARFLYFVEMLDLALRKTREEYGDYRIEPATIPISQERAFDLVKRGRYLDVVWGMTSIRREQQVRPVRIPLLKGLLGHRVLLVRRDNLPGIQRISAPAELARLTGIQGSGWPDTAILKANDMNIVTSTDYDGMFEMVTSGRVDYFPRSVAEVWPEITRFRDDALVISPSPLIVYKGPIYFFVNPDNAQLAERLALGLQRAIDDGSFDKQFRSRDEIRQAIAFLEDAPRTLIRLNNPNLPPATPVADTRLWYQYPP